MKKDKLFIASLIGNTAVFLLVLVGVILMFTIGGDALAVRNFSVFKYFTLQSNIFAGVIALIYVIFQILVLKGKMKDIPHIIIVLNHVAVTAIALTFLVTPIFLVPVYGFSALYVEANLFFHALAPLAALITFMFLTRDANISFKEIAFCMMPCAIYGVFYILNVAINNGYGDLEIDFYSFGKYGLGIGILNYFLLLLVSYLIGLFVYFINHLVFKKRR